jgi:delta 1-pyrroline-5-carboxylate dehydrogenase
MCEPTTLAIAGLAGTAISAAGSYYSAQQQKKASQAVADQNWQTTQAQNKAFDTRMQAQTQRTTSDYNSYMQQIADQQASAAQMRQQQSGALSRQEQVLNAENQQAEAIRASADAQSQNMQRPELAQPVQPYGCRRPEPSRHVPPFVPGGDQRPRLRAADLQCRLLFAAASDRE